LRAQEGGRKNGELPIDTGEGGRRKINTVIIISSSREAADVVGSEGEKTDYARRGCKGKSSCCLSLGTGKSGKKRSLADLKRWPFVRKKYRKWEERQTTSKGRGETGRTRVSPEDIRHGGPSG